jgi:ATP-binding cassette subfamily B protein/ATP-binding cassette subfamily C protein LapB
MDMSVPATLAAPEVPRAAAALFAADGVAARAAVATLRPWVQSANWDALATQLGGGEISLRRYAGSIAGLFDEHFELALLRLDGDRFVLLQYQAPHWHAVDVEGVAESISPAALSALAGGGASDVDAVLMNLPHDEDMALAAVAQIRPLLRAAWLEVGIASFFINAGLLLLPLFALLVYDKVVGNGVFETLWALVIGVLVFIGMDAAMRIVRNWSVERIAADLTERSDERLWHRLQAQTELPGGVAHLLAEYRNLAAARDFVSANYLMGLADLPFFVLYMVVIGIIAWPLLILILVLVLAYALAGAVLQARINRFGREAEQAGTAKLALMGDVLGALDVLRTVPAAHFVLRRWRAATAASASIEARRRLLVSHAGTLAAALAGLTLVAVLTLGAYLIDARMLTIGGLIAASMLASRAMAMVAGLFGLLAKWNEFRRTSARVEASLAPVPEAARVDKPEATGRIDVIGLTRQYAGRPTALDKVGFSIEPGERIGLLGRPGSGKSTLLRCIAGLGQPDAGQILIDGVALPDIGGGDRARWLAYKAQDPVLFAATLDENLRISGCRPESPRFARALWVSGLDDELRSGRLTLGMAIAERGANLSGGQRQKVALARVLAQAAHILLLDEPTLGLDPDGERQFAERLPELLGDGVLIVSTHSPALLSVVQRVIALDAGRIVADGPKDRILRVGAGKIQAAR